LQRTILEFEKDEEDDWRVVLDCGHKRHLRHDPPREIRPQLSDPSVRESAIGNTIDCGRCRQRLLPDGMEVYKSTPEFSEETVPAGLLKDHSLKSGVWGRLVVLEGSLRFCEGELRIEVKPETRWHILPDVIHNVEVVGPVRFRVDFLKRVASTT
jgi:tellurite resistance-related uncharacterized protein